MTYKPEVATILVLGTVERGNGEEYALFCQQRGLLRADGEPVASAGKVSGIGEHMEPEDTSIVDAVVRGAREELGLNIYPMQVTPLGERVETDRSFNTVFVLDTMTSRETFKMYEGSGPCIIPLRDLRAYFQRGLVTEATYATYIQAKPFVEKGLHHKLFTSGLSSAMEEFVAALPERHEVDIDAMRGEIISLSDDEVRMIEAVRKQGKGKAFAMWLELSNFYWNPEDRENDLER